MEHRILIYNTLTRSKEVFEPLSPPHVGMYVCGPTVYGDPHLGHARPAIVFDVVFRYLTHLGYKVRYVRNITDVGHLENDADEGEDKIQKKARLASLEPMEIVQYYTNRYHHFLEKLNCLSPGIEPQASGHIIEQQTMISELIAKGFAYETNGSVYFDVKKYSQSYHYGKLSGRVLDDLLANTRDLDGQSDKRNAFDFALWKKAEPGHIMRWPSPWSQGYPGWHLECSVMGRKYLGETFDIHGGGMDLIFPHHECEIAQSVGALGHESVKYWMHNNLITINGQKMGKSLGNFITLEELFTGTHAALEQTYTPMTVRFFILQAHYRGTLDFSNQALQAAQKGLQRLLTAFNSIAKIKPAAQSSVALETINQQCYQALDDDFNTPVLIAQLFEAVRIINSALTGTESLTSCDIALLTTMKTVFVESILGLAAEGGTQDNTQELTAELIELLLSLRQEVKAAKNYALADTIRNKMSDLGVEVKDTKEGYEWSINRP